MSAVRVAVALSRGWSMQASNLRLRRQDARSRGPSMGSRAPVRVVCAAPAWKQKAFGNFRKEKYKELQQKNDHVHFSDLNPVVSEAWRNMSDEEKRRYSPPPRVDQGYYYPPAPPSYYPPPMAGPAPGYPGAPGGFTSHGALPEMSGHRGLTKWQSFLKTNFPAIREEMMKQDPDVPNTAVISELGKRWRAMSEAQKAVYVDHGNGKVKVDRPRSGWQMYQLDNYRDVAKMLKAKDPGALITTKDVQGELGRRWKDLPEAHKQQYANKGQQAFDQDHGFAHNGGPPGADMMYGQGPYGYPQQYPPQQYPYNPKGRAR